MLELLFILIQVVILDGILSLDNAAVLGTIAHKLPADAKSPLPRFFNFLGTNQRDVALKIGILGAYAGRGLMLLITGVLISFPILKIIGALYLYYLVYKYFKGLYEEGGEEGESKFAKKANGFWKTVLLIEIADLVFSIDNVIAVMALSSHIFVIIFGVFVSILIMRFAAQFFMKLLNFEPLLEHAAYVLIFVIASEMVLKYFHVDINEFLQFSISISILVMAVVYGRIRKLHQKAVLKNERR